VRKEAKQVRIIVELSDATHGGQIWGDRFEGELEKVFDLQDSVAASVSATIAPALRSIEAEHARRKSTDNLTAYDLYLRALPPHRDTFAQNQESLRLLYKAIELDPSFGAAYGLAAYCHLMQLVFAWHTPPEHWVREGVRLANLAAEKGENDSEALWMAGRTVAALAGEADQGLALIAKSISLNPNSARAWWVSGMTHAHLGHAETALDHFTRARRLNPFETSTHGHWNGIAQAYLFSGKYEAAKEAVDAALIDWPNSPPALRVKAAICGLLGRIEEGRECVRQMLTLNPDTTVATVKALNQLQMKPNPRGFSKFLDGLRKSGLPEDERL
jgi:tetratricopeptide (TPR) repeat protein